MPNPPREPYTCPHCHQRYDVKPKWCPCTPYPQSGPETQESYLLIGPDEEQQLDQYDYQTIQRLAKKKPKHGDYRLFRQRVRFGIETLDIQDYETTLTKEEYQQAKHHLAERLKNKFKIMAQ